MQTVLTIQNLTKKYKNGRGVENISLEVEKGDIVGLLGPNGSGKTTTMKAVMGLCPIDRGTIKIKDVDVTEDTQAALSDVGALIETPALYEYLTAEKNLKLAARLYPGVDDNRIDHILEVVRLLPYKKEKVGKFSLGMRQRLGFGLALLSNPELVILDEPSNGLDIEGRVEMREIILKLSSQRQTTFLVASHLSAELEKLCNKVAIMHEGSMLSFDLMEDALSYNPTLEDYYLTKVRERRGEVII